ncbi:MAG: hypothetical protein NZ703_02610 [Gemmataceae bacterium]|nr:hypothetical protein [Gemmataceae bacterium]
MMWFSVSLGDCVPDLPLSTCEGTVIRLYQLLDHDYLLLIFLRHLT